MARDESAIALTKASGVNNMEKWFAAKSPLKLGTTGPGAFGTDNVIKVVKAALNLPIQVISGYKGTADMRIAAESGEIDGTTWGWDSMRGTWQKALESGTVVVVLQTVPKAFADLAGSAARHRSRQDGGSQTIDRVRHSLSEQDHQDSRAPAGHAERARADSAESFAGDRQRP